MAVDIVMPQMGESIFEGTITKWLKKPGDKVERDEPLFEISTDKVDAEIPSPSAGVLKEIKVGEGKTVPIQTVVGVIEAGDGAGAAKAAATAPAPAPAAKPQIVPPPQAAKPAAPAPAAAASGPGPAPSRPAGERIHSSPLVRRMAKEHGINLGSVPGTGAGGRISKQDIEAYLAGGVQPSAEAAEPGAAEYAPAASAPQRAAAAPPPPPATSGGQVHVAFESAVPREKMYFGHYEVQPMSVMRQRIAEHMIASKRVSAHVYSVDEVDMTKVASLRAKSKDEFEKRYETKLTFMPFFIKAAVAGLRAFPTMNASLDGTNVIIHKEINIGIAVALEWGLIVPVVKNADEKNILGLARTINELGERARTKRLSPDEVSGGTFTITNPGIYGGLFGTPIINQPQVAILGVGGVKKRPIVVETADGDFIAIRSICILSLTFDHRLVDGAVADQFMAKLKSVLEAGQFTL